MFLSEITRVPCCNRGFIQVCEWSSLSAANNPASFKGVVFPSFTDCKANLPNSECLLGSCVTAILGKGNSLAISERILTASPLPEPSPPSTEIRYISPPVGPQNALSPSSIVPSLQESILVQI